LFSFIRGLAYAAFFNACYTLVGDISPPNKRAQYMSMNLASSFIGISIGSAVGGEVTQRMGSQSPFILILILLVGALVFTHITVDESIDVQPTKPFELRRLLEFRNPTVMIIYLVSFVTFFTTTSISDVFTSLYSSEVLTLSLAEVGLVITLDSVSNLCTLTFFGRVSDRLGRKSSMLLGLAVFALTASLVMPLGARLFLLFVVCFGIAKGILSPVIRAVVIDVADVEHRGLALGVQRIFCDLGGMLGPLMLGIVSDIYGVPSVFVVAAVMCAGTCFVVLFMKRPTTVTQ